MRKVDKIEIATYVFVAVEICNDMTPRNPTGATLMDHRACDTPLIVSKKPCDPLASGQTIEVSLGDSLSDMKVDQYADLRKWANEFAHYVVQMKSTVPSHNDTNRVVDLWMKAAVSDWQRETICEAVRKGVEAALFNRANESQALFLRSEYQRDAHKRATCVGIYPDLLLDLFKIGWNAVLNPAPKPGMQNRCVCGLPCYGEYCPDCQGVLDCVHDDR